MSRSKLAALVAWWTVGEVLVLAALLFIVAGTVRYWQAWVFIVVFAVSVGTVGMYVAVNDPALLARRRKAGPTKEQRPAQRVIASLFIVSANALVVTAAVDHRVGWSGVPPILSVVGDLVFGLGVFILLLVFRANSYGGSSVEIVASTAIRVRTGGISGGERLHVRCGPHHRDAPVSAARQSS